MGASTNIKQQIREYIVENILFGDGDALDENIPFQESGILDSTGFIGLVTFVEGRFGITISDEELNIENMETLSKISHFVEEKLGGQKGNAGL